MKRGSLRHQGSVVRKRATLPQILGKRCIVVELSGVPADYITEVRIPFPIARLTTIVSSFSRKLGMT